MTHVKYIILAFLVLLGLISCKITDSLSTFSIETLKPVAFSFPESVKTVAIINRDTNKNASHSLYNFGKGNFPCDTTLNNFELSNYCVDGLASFLEQENYFQKVNNFIVTNRLNRANEGIEEMYNTSEMFELTKADALIFLDFFQFENEVSVFYDATYRTKAALSWTIIFNDVTPSVTYNQIDTLFFDKSQYLDIRKKNENRKLIYQDAAQNLGKRFGTKIIPYWDTEELSYYHSLHPKMRKAEKYLKSYDWLKAGEIYNKLTENKNQKIAAKSCWNMAVACEMEEKYDLAIEWLVDSNNILTKNNLQHRLNCLQYMRVLTLRKAEIERLNKQIRN
ncbi:MAG TPA: DUF6340 family protein [Draconibacterium sp.]|nr:DUF6340 family protein [Draconibacterium sp.]HRX10880.1 DUF6340 family protein [Draconibacterium sp.]